MTELLDLCYDVLIRILEEVHPSDLAACAQTSSAFNNFIRENSQLHKAHYLKNFDDPRRSSISADPKWIPELHKVVRCQKILESASNDLKREEFKFVASTVDNLINNASTGSSGISRNQQKLSELFLHISQNHNAFMCRSSLYKRAGTDNQKPADEEEDRQLSARLHCLFGIPTSNTGRRVLSTHPYARSKVYDLRNYTNKTKWGPFRRDGSMKVDWEMIESLMIILGYNSGLCCRRFQPRFSPPWSDPLQGVVGEKARQIPDYDPKLLHQPDVPLSMKDPYNVTGVWSRIVCFLDYNDLHNFNFGENALKFLPNEQREPLIKEEAIRHIIMDIKVTKVTCPGLDCHQDFPVVHFDGKSRSVDASWDPNANSKIKGSVNLTKEGEVRWQTVSIFYGGEERWRSEGIQVGGLKSQRGVVGTWFDKDYDIHGPAGPTAFWKISDNNLELEDSDSEEEAHVGHWHV